MNEYFVYLLKSEKDQKFYIGYTQDIEERMDAHNNGQVKSTKNRRPMKLVYYEAYLNQRDALGREKFLKSGAGHKFLRKQLRHYFEDQEALVQ